MISVIIPTLNEGAELPRTLAALSSQGVPHEVLVVDAHSTDSTAILAREGGANLIAGPRRQRAAQMNLGAAVARGEALLFLHADTRLPAGALAKMLASLAKPDVAGGGFARRYDSPSPFLRLTCALAEVRTRAFGWFLGDQAIFVRQTAFAALGGFREWDSFEDLDFSRRMARVGRVVTLRPPVISAARRFDARGAVWTTWRDLRLTARYLSGGSDYCYPKDNRPLACGAGGQTSCSRRAGSPLAAQTGPLRSKTETSRL